MGKLPDNYRFERKYSLKTADYASILQKVIKNGLTTHHPPRYINNLYLDTLSRDAYYENVEGVSERNKYRFRWYGTRFGKFKPTLEVKIKKEYLNKKISLKLPKANLLSLNDIPRFYEELSTEVLKKKSNLYIACLNRSPHLLNGYHRDYFISPCGSTRLTIDSDLWFFNPRSQRIANPKNLLIVEMKHARDKKPAIDMNDYGFQLSKSSKFVTGLDLTSF